MSAPARATRAGDWQGPPLPDDAMAYCDAVRAHPLVESWYALAEEEPAAWRLPRYETLL